MRRYLWLTLFGIAMAYLESAVVIYLRQVYFPDGFRFPIELVPIDAALIELARELATIAMLLAIAVLAGRDRMESFLHFCYLFGVWDVFYYVWLKVCIGWPSSLLTWDILFLLPLPWLGPVISPVLVSAGLIAGSVILLRLRAGGVALDVPGWMWGLEIVAGLMVIVSFVWEFRVVLEGRVPHFFNWPLYGSGMALGIAVFFLAVRRLPARAA